MKNNVETPPSIPERVERAQEKPSLSAQLVMLSGMCALILCVLFMAAPLNRLAGTPVSELIPGGNLLVKAGSWLPGNLHTSSNPYLNQLGTGTIEFVLLMAVAFGVYGVCAWGMYLLLRRSSTTGQRGIMPLIWLGAIIAGLIFVLTPALLSHDVFVYAGYGRLIDVYHANPYFVPFSAYRHDQIFPLDDWGTSTAPYGPLWMVVCSLVGLVAGAHPLRYILLFRLLELLAHLVNILLVVLILRKMERSPRTVALGAMLYAWNPLMLLESSQGGHNDIIVVTFILLGLLLMARAEAHAPSRLRSAILPIIAFTLAALVKYTIIPLVALAIFALVFRSLCADTAGTLNKREMLARRWRPALLIGFAACMTSGIVIAAFYGPFFLGHSLQAIAQSFTNPPSSRMAHKSILDGITQQLLLHPAPSNSLLVRLSRPKLWDVINVATIAGSMIIGALWLWRKPTTRTFILASLLTLGAFLLVAPWFLPWYVTWLVPLAVVCLPVKGEPVVRGLVAFALTFSATALVLYLYNGVPPANTWSIASCVFTFGPPLLAFFIAILPWPQPPTSHAVEQLDAYATIKTQ